MDRLLTVNLTAMAWGFQNRVWDWSKKTFGETLAFEPLEPSRRFLEESLELSQAAGVSKEQALQLVEYVFSRPVGEANQEVGGVVVTLGLLCKTMGLNFGEEGERELLRIDTPELIQKIRAKQVSKHLHGIGGTPEAAELNKESTFSDVPSGYGDVP